MGYESTSCLLFHGPGAEAMGYAQATAFGRLLPFTGSSLKKEGARELVGLLAHRPVGGGRASVLVGPIDEVNPATSDVLLKTIEDFDPEGIRPFLWAWDLGGVSVTLRSRCILKFCPGTDTRTEAFESMADTVLKAFLDGDCVTLIEEVKEQEDVDLLLRAVVDRVAVKLLGKNPDPRYAALWDVLRPLFGSGTLTPARVVSAFLMVDQGV